MKTSLLSRKFQVVVPKEIRTTLNLRPGQRLHVTARDGHIELSPILSPKELIGCLREDRPLQFERERAARKSAKTKPPKPRR
jgi:AbrB family looped-hinge helix DNA binding protein